MEIKRDYGILGREQYFHEAQAKDRIVLHHTEGGSARSTVDWWNKHPDRVCTAYLVDRDGTVLELFPPTYWAWGLGIGSMAEEKRSIQVELCSYGALEERDGKLYRWTGAPFDGDFVEHADGWRGRRFYERYTGAQVSSTVSLVKHLAGQFGISLEGLDGFWHYDRGSGKGVISHSTVRRDKSDIHPQADLVAGIVGLGG